MKKRLFSSIFLVLLTSYLFGQLSVSPNQTATNLANYLLGGGVTISNAQLTCPSGANAIFTNGGTTNLGLNSGIVLTTGLASSIPNGNGTNASTNNGAGGIAQMAPLTGTSSNYDGCMLEFDITPRCSPLNIRYKFASEEYPEYVNSGYNDGFGFFITGPNPLGGNYTNFNLATVPGGSTPVTIDNINSSSNSAYYISNSGSTIVYDGMTTVLTGSANVTPCANYHLILAITDGGDQVYDSGVFLEQSGISCISPTITANDASICAGQSATLNVSGASTYTWSTGSNATSIVVSPALTTTYSVGGSNIGTCIQSSKIVTVTVNPAPTANAGPTRTLTCANTSTTLSGSGGGTYAWSGPGIVSGGTSSNPTINQAGTYTLIVTSAGCPSLPSTVTVVNNTTPPTPAASSTGTLTCTNNTVSLTASGGGTYSWSGTGIVSGGNTANPVVNGTGPYVVTVTAANGCTATANTSVAQNTTPPTANASNTATLTCATTTAALSATGGGTYSWSGTGIVSGGNTANPVVNGTGPYVVTVTAANGCTATANTSVAQNTTPPTANASNTATLTCATTTAALSATGGGTYSWSGTGILSGGNTANPVVNGTGPYVVTVTAANGCTATANTSVAQNTTPPTANASNTATLTCATTTAALSATGGGTYSWSGTGIVSGGNTANPVVNGTGPYVVTVTAANGCTATANTSVAQNTTPPTAGANHTGSLTCSTTSLTLNGTGGGTYSWSGPSIISGNNTSSPNVNQTGTYIVTVTAANGCTATANTTVGQNTTTPTVNAGSSQTLVCGANSVTLTGSASAGSTANWQGGVCGSATNFTTTACAPGTYTLIATNAVSSCTNSATVSVSSSTNVPQATVNAVTNSITCTNTVVAIGVTLSNSDPVSYSWSGPNISGGTTSPNTTASAPGTYSVVITNTVTNCQSVYSTIVPSNTVAPNPSVATPSNITCSTQTVSLQASPTGSGYSYSWSGPGTILNGTTDNATVNSNGNYVVTVTDNINNCFASYTVTVNSNTTVPTLNLSSNTFTTTCATPTVMLGATSNSDPNSTYSWSVSAGGTLNNTTISNPIAGSGGVYTAVVTNTINGCVSAPQSLTVTADANIPTFTLTTSTATLTCNNSAETVTLTSTSNDLTYNWNPSPQSGGNTPTPTFNTPGTYSCTITNTVNNCSTGAAQVTVTSNTNIPTVTTTSGTLTCSNQSVTIVATSTPSSGVNFTWSGPSIIGSNTGSNIDVNASGNYSVNLIDATNGCTNTAVVSILSNTTSPTLTASASSTTISCSMNTTTLNAVASVTDAITWTTPSGNSANPVVATVAGNYVATVTDVSNGCSTSQTLTVSGNTVVPNVDAGINAFIPCGTSSVTLNATSTATDVVSYSWTGPNGTSIVTGSNTANPTVQDSGKYVLTITNSFGCTSTDSIYVSLSNVVAAFNGTPLSGISPLDVNFTDASVGATNFNWNFGDGATSSTQNPNHTFNSGTYTVMLIATSGSCSDTAYTVVVVEDGLTLEIPNVFTPNGDGVNELFVIKSTGIKEITLQIFNRWGEKLYEFSGPKASWDGKAPSGEDVPEGTYFYFVKAIGFDDKEIEQHGSVNLFR